MSDSAEAYLQLGPFDRIPKDTLRADFHPTFARDDLFAAFDTSRESPEVIARTPPAGWRKVRDDGGRDVWAAPDGNQWWTANAVPKGGVTLLAVSPFPVSTLPPRSARRKGLVLRPVDAVLTRSLSESTALRLEYVLINTSSARWENLADDTSTLAIFAEAQALGFQVFGVGDSLSDLDTNESITLTGSLNDDLALGTHRVIADLVDLNIRAETETTLTLVP